MTALPFAGAPLLVDSERCLNLRHRRAGCTRCAVACPVAAIGLTAGQPTLDAERCVRCGVCLTACPTDVFTQPHPSESLLAQTCEQVAGDAIALVCPQHPAPNLTPAPVAAVVRHERCLAALDPADLLALSQHGQRPLWLDDSVCTNCPIGGARTMLVRCVHTANTLLQAGTQPVAIHLLTESVEFTTDETQPRPLIGGNQAKLSRRGLFSGLRQRAQALMYTGIVPIEGALVANRIPAQQRLPQNAPASRARLLAELSQLNLDPKCSLARSSLPFADVQVNRDRCSACGLCARFCPTAALQFSADKRLFALSFQTAHCIDCGICLQACPEDAIQLAETIPAVDLTMPAPNLLIDGSLTLCVDCGQPTAHRSDNTDPHRCYSCRQGAGLVRSLHDGAGLMADLLSRIPGSR